VTDGFFWGLLIANLFPASGIVQNKLQNPRPLGKKYEKEQ